MISTRPPSIFQVEGVLTKEAFAILDHAKRASDKAMHVAEELGLWNTSEYNHVGSVRLRDRRYEPSSELGCWLRARQEIKSVEGKLSYIAQAQGSDTPVGKKIQECLRGEVQIFKGLEAFYGERLCLKIAAIGLAILGWISVVFRPLFLIIIGVVFYQEIHCSNPCAAILELSKRVHGLTWEATLMVDYDSEYEDSDPEL